MAAASMRILNPQILNRHISIIISSKSLRFHHSLSSSPQNAAVFCSSPRFSSSFSTPFTYKFPLSLSFSSFALNSHPHGPSPVESGENGNGFLRWHRRSTGAGLGGGGGGGGRAAVTAVVLGWLGAKQKHLRRYAEVYTERGIEAVTFVVPVREVLGFDLGRKVENRIQELLNQLVLWLLSEKDGEERCLIFHTFSNTGWLVYGAILSHLQSRPHLLKKIKGCIVDSGGDPELNTKVWAAGFSAALLQRRSSVAPMGEAVDGGQSSDTTMSTMKEKEFVVVEEALLLFLEKLFCVLFKLPDVNRRLSRVISLLKENQPPCPQLYLYSTADKVIPYRSVESFIEDQKRSGRDVEFFNFVSSPHVDHYRNFPQVYSSHVYSFLDKVFGHRSQVNT